MRITVLDAATLGEDLSMECFSGMGDLTVYQSTAPDEVCEHISGAEILIFNKVRLSRNHLADCDTLRLICITTTGTNTVSCLTIFLGLVCSIIRKVSVIRTVS